MPLTFTLHRLGLGVRNGAGGKESGTNVTACL
jgi:hypothetical protein